MSHIDTSADAVMKVVQAVDEAGYPTVAEVISALLVEREAALEACRIGNASMAKLRHVKYELEQAGTFEQGVQAAANAVNQLWLDNKDRTDISHTAVLHLAHHTIRALVHPSEDQERVLYGVYQSQLTCEHDWVKTSHSGNVCKPCGVKEDSLRQAHAESLPSDSISPDRIDAAAEYLAKYVMQYDWNGLRKDGRSHDQGFQPWKVGGHNNARQEDYRDVVREIVRLTDDTAYAEGLEAAARVMDAEVPRHEAMQRIHNVNGSPLMASASSNSALDARLIAKQFRAMAKHHRESQPETLETVIARLDKTRQTLKSDGYQQGGETIGSIMSAIRQLQELSKR